MLELTGHSGCTTEIVTVGSKVLVRKTAPDQVTYERLLRQIRRQMQSRTIYDGFRAPVVFSKHWRTRSFEMEHIVGLAPLRWLEISPRGDRSWFYSEIVKYLTHTIAESKMVDFDPVKFVEKVATTAKNIQNRSLAPEVRREIGDLSRRIMDEAIRLRGSKDYLYEVHGDLTLSNMLITPAREIIWLDFLDGWNHSVFCDMAKLRQEINYLWSYRFCADATIQNYGAHLGELERKLEGSFFNPPIHVPLFKLYCALNDFRLLQYEKEPAHFFIIMGEVSGLIP